VTPLTLIVVALVQGITEFLPISSSAHLVLIHEIAGWPDQGLAIDVAAHVGSLVAVLVYFRRDIAGVGGGAIAIALAREHPDRRLVWMLVVATLPALLAGAALEEAAESALRSVAVIAWTMTLGAVLLYLADRLGTRARTTSAMRLPEALAIGLAQALALVPGTSRAGITMTMALALGFARTDAARFSMLLSIPVILGAGTLQAVKLLAAGNGVAAGDALVVALLSGAAAFAAIWLLMRWLEHASFTPLVIYRLGLGLVLLAVVYV
jgi:undecaprenyl-diphosphatase